MLFMGILKRESAGRSPPLPSGVRGVPAFKRLRFSPGQPHGVKAHRPAA